MKIIRKPKYLVYVILLILLTAAVVYYFMTHSSLSESLFTTTLGMFVTVILIDTLLQIDKKQKYKSLNRLNARSLKLSIAFCLLSARNDLGDKRKYKTDDVDRSTHELTELFEANLKNLVLAANTEQLKKFCDTILNTANSIDKVLDRIIPYPSLETKTTASDLAIKPSVLSELIKVHTELSGITANSKQSSKETETLKKLDDLQRENYFDIVGEIKQNLLYLHKLASNDDLQEII